VNLLQKFCYVDVSGENGIFLFPNINKDTLNEILKYKSWNFSTWNNSTTEIVSYLESYDTKQGTIVKVKDGLGFVPILIKHLNGLGYTILDNEGYNFNLLNGCHKVRFPQFRFKLRDYQINCALKWRRDRMGIIKSPTASGKTVIGAYLIKDCSYKTLILVHEKSLINHWESKLANIFGLSFENRIGVFSGDKGKEIDKALHKDVVIGTYQLSLIGNNIKKLKNAGFGLLIAEEVHHIAAETFKKVVNSLLIPYRLGISATPKRLDGKEPEIYALVDSIKASILIRGLIEKGFVVEPHFYNISWLDTEINKKVAKQEGGLRKSTMLKTLSSNSYVKYSVLIKLLEQFRREHKTFLLYVDRKVAAENIEHIINEMITKKDRNFKVIGVTQKMSGKERFDTFAQLGKKYVGLVFAKIGSEGIDIPTVDCVVILNPSKSVTTFSQRTGRALRPNPGKIHAEIYQFILVGSMEKAWAEYSFDEFRQEGFIQKNIVIR